MKTANAQSNYEQRGLWEPFVYRVRMSAEEMLQALRKQSRVYRTADDWTCWDAILRGELPILGLTRAPATWNKVTRGLRGDTWGQRLVNGASADDTGILYFMSVGTNNAPASETQTTLGNEIFRAAPTSKKYLDADRQAFLLLVDYDDANPGVSTTVAAGTWTTASFEVADATGLAAGDAIWVGTSPVTGTSRIQSVVGDAITLDPSLPLPYIPTVGQTVELAIGEVGTHGNEDATSSADTGKMFSRAALRLQNNDQLAYLIRTTFIGASV